MTKVHQIIAPPVVSSIIELKRLATDNAGFDALVAKLRADRSINQAAMREIAIAFLGWEMAKSKSRAKLLQMIEERQALDARQEARGQVIDRMHSW